MKRILMALILFPALCAMQAHAACSTAILIPAGDPAQSQFMVSGVLRKSSTDIEIKLVHSLEAAASSDAALGAFTRKALKDFPGYSMVSTLVSRIELPKKAECGRSI